VIVTVPVLRIVLVVLVLVQYYLLAVLVPSPTTATSTVPSQPNARITSTPWYYVVPAPSTKVTGRFWALRPSANNHDG
jgi:hypothetical protein